MTAHPAAAPASKPPASGSLGAPALIAANGVPAFWAHFARTAIDFARTHGLPVRDLVVLLPFAQHLPLARDAWLAAARHGDDGGIAAAQWLPRLETTRTLMRSIAPPGAAVQGALAFDPVTDRLQAAALLRERLPQWPRRDARGFALAAARVAELAQALAQQRLALPPSERDAWLAQARVRLSSGGAGPGAEERLLAQLALAWSADADASRHDALFALAPAGWIALRAGAPDPLAQSLLAGSKAPVLWIDGDLAFGAAGAAKAAVQAEGACADIAATDVRIATCRDFEDEAQRSAAQVIAHLARGQAPVALIALDRVLVRRVRALLERSGVAVADETGWKLSTTRAGAAVVGLLRAVQARATTDELLDWLKSSPRDWHGLDALESSWRRHAVSLLMQVDEADLAGAARSLWQRWQVGSEPLRPAHAVPLEEWLARLRTALERTALWQPLQADAAGAQVLDALRCHAQPALPWPSQVLAGTLDASAFLAWVDDVLEQAAYTPVQAQKGSAQVVITPLARAMLRPFAAIVCPGADASHLGAWPAPAPLLGDALATLLGLPGAAARREAERRAFVQLLRAPTLTLLHRRREGIEPVQPSPLLRQLRHAADALNVAAADDARPLRTIAPAPVERPLPCAPSLLPARVDASSYEALRACPYRYFAQCMLGLAEDEELDDALDQRDYGRWLHGVLEAFHARRETDNPTHDADADAHLLTSIAHDRQRVLGRQDADFLPYALWFDKQVLRYLDWLHEQEAQGAAVRETEAKLEARPAELAPLGLTMTGRIDRIDALRGASAKQEQGAGDGVRIVDYKSGSRRALLGKLAAPLEDTQLPFYAALLAAARGEPAGGIEAGYLALDSRDAIQLLLHKDVQASAAVLLEGIASDFARLRAGAALPALGEGSTCDFCRARGLCRRDHWREEARPSGDPAAYASGEAST